MSRERVDYEGKHGCKHWQRDRHRVVCRANHEQRTNVLELSVPELANALQVGYLPGKVLDDLHAPEKLLQELRALVRPHHALLTEAHELAHDARLDRRAEHEERVPCERGRPEVDDEQYEADCHLDGRDPREVEEAAAEVDARDVRRDVVHELAVGQRRARARRQPQRTVVDGRDEPPADEHARGGAPVEEVMLAEGREELHCQETEGETNTPAYWRDVVVPTCIVCTA